MLRRNGQSHRAQLSSPGDTRSAFQQVQRNLANGPVLDLFERRAGNPLIESAHRWTTPDLIVRRAARRAFTRPLSTLEQVAARHQREALVAIRFGALCLARIDALDIGLRCLPGRLERLAENVIEPLLVSRAQRFIARA